MSAKPNEYDVIIIGAGPAGSCAACAAVKEGLKVLVVDRRTNPGTPIQCAEYVPAVVSKYATLAPRAVVQRISCLVTYIYGEEASIIKSPGYILDRSVFDAGLAEEARRLGSHMWLGTRALAYENNELYCRTNNDFIKARGKIIIGADGPVSIVGQWMNSTNLKFMVALQWRMLLSRPHDSTDVYLEPQYRGGYAWLFPRGKEVNIGVGVQQGCHSELPGLVKDFVQSMMSRGLVLDMPPRAVTGGLIPVGGPLPVTGKGNMMLCGDAAGLTHAITGGGIMNAMVSGLIAGRTAARAIKEDDLTILQQYHWQWSDLLGNFLKRAARQRQIMDQKWSEQPAEFNKLMRQTWIGFNHNHR